MDVIKDLTQLRPRRKAEIPQIMSVDHLTSALQATDLLDVIHHANRFVKDGAPPRRTMGTGFAVSNQHLKKIMEQRIARSESPTIWHFSLAQEANLLASPHLGEVGDAHMVAHETAQPLDLQLAQSQSTSYILDHS